jgi:hypothetical protein
VVLLPTAMVCDRGRSDDDATMAVVWRGDFRMSSIPKIMHVAGLVLAFSSYGFAQNLPREVIVNDKLMNNSQLRILDELNCGNPVSNGSYWLNIDTGAWGNRGGPQLGVVGEACAPAQSPAQNQKSDCEAKYRFHEDRMCYCYHVC